jgi:hypothetical protein
VHGTAAATDLIVPQPAAPQPVMAAPPIGVAPVASTLKEIPTNKTLPTFPFQEVPEESCEQTPSKRETEKNSKDLVGMILSCVATVIVVIWLVSMVRIYQSVEI